MTKITAELTKTLLIDGAMSTALEQLGADTNNCKQSITVRLALATPDLLY